MNLVGDTIELRITGDAEGTPGHAFYPHASFDASLVRWEGTTQETAVPFGYPWPGVEILRHRAGPGLLSRVRTDHRPDGVRAADPFTSTMTFTAIAAGTLELGIPPPDGNDFLFFDLESPPGGLRMRIVDPEPGTAGLVGTGLIALARRRRR